MATALSYSRIERYVALQPGRCRAPVGAAGRGGTKVSKTTGTLQAVPRLLDLPIGINASGQRHETDSMGGIDVPANRYWGAQTQRSLVHFSIRDDNMPKAVYHAYGYVKKPAGLVNAAARRLAQWPAEATALVGSARVGLASLRSCAGRWSGSVGRRWGCSGPRRAARCRGRE